MKKYYRSIDDLPVVLSVEDIAITLQVSIVTAYNLTKKVGFPAIRIGRRIVVPKDSFVGWMRKNTLNQVLCQKEA